MSRPDEDPQAFEPIRAYLLNDELRPTPVRRALDGLACPRVSHWEPATTWVACLAR